MDSRYYALIALIAFTAIAGFALFHSISPYVTPSQLLKMESANNVQVVGVMKNLRYLGNVTEFYLSDGSADVRVVYTGRAKEVESEIVVVGDWKNGVLYAKNILRKCHTEYTGG